jgi:hypothetical protein
LKGRGPFVAPTFFFFFGIIKRGSLVVGFLDGC